MQFDVHTHFFLPEAAENPTGWSRQRKEFHWPQLVAPADKTSRQGWATPEEMIGAMDRDDIGKAIVQGWYWENQDTIEEQNEALARTLSPYRNRLRLFAAFLPGGSNREMINRAERLLERGFSGFGEISPTAQKFPLKDSSWLAFARWAEKKDVPVCLHVNEPVAKPRAGWQPESLQDYLEFALAFPRLRLILAHLGGLLPIYASNPGIRRSIQSTRLLFDTAALPLLYHPRIFASLPPKSVLPRILFGSDYPLKLENPPEKQPSWAPSLAYLERTSLTPEQKDEILRENARHHLPEIFS